VPVSQGSSRALPSDLVRPLSSGKFFLTGGFLGIFAFFATNSYLPGADCPFFSPPLGKRVSPTQAVKAKLGPGKFSSSSWAEFSEF